MRQFCGIVFSKYFILGNFTKLYSQNFSFEATSLSCIFSKNFIWGNSAEFYSQNVSLWGKSMELYSHTFFWGNSTKLYSQNISFETTLRSYILKTLPMRQFYLIVFSEPSPLRQFYGIVFSHFLFWDNFEELHFHKCLRTLYPHVNKLMVTKWDVILALVFIYCINSTNEGHLLTPHFVTINFTFFHFNA